ncbi:MAG TPA: AAA family ATPase, partial [Polyangia bacterium]
RQRLDGGARPASPAAQGELLRVVERLCEALAFLHGEGVVHRDLKPENVFIDERRGPVLVDFGLAMEVQSPLGRERLEAGGAGRGSLDYVAPEQLHGGTVDARADLYSLGCILYEILAGRPPFPGGQWAPSPPPPLDDAVPPSLRQLVARLVTFRARERLGHALDVAAVLASLRGASLEHARPTRSYLYRPSFVGRDEVLARIGGSLDAARRGRGDALYLGAPSGSGKTRLTTEALALATARSVRVVVGECAPLAASQPLATLAPLMQAVVDHCRVAGRGETERILGARGPILGAQWPELKTLPGQSRYPDPPAVGGRAARERLIEALVDTVVLFAERAPLMLVFDDLQWADELTLELLDHLEADALAEHGVVVLGTFRSDETTAALRRFADGRRTLVKLPPLDGAAMASIIADMLALDAAPPALVDAVAAHAEGNPLFVAEYLRAAVAEELVKRDRVGRWLVPESVSRDRVDALGVPVTLRELIVQRLARLGDGARRLAERAAVLGREFELAWLEATSPLGEAETLEALNELCVREVLESAPNGRLRFVHDKVREVAYGELGAAACRALHESAARMIEERAAGRRDLYAVLAHHYSLASVDDKAIEYLERAGEHALELGAHGDAIALVGQALARDEQPGRTADQMRRAHWQQMLGEAAFALGDLIGCRDHLGRVVAALHAPLPRA